MKSETPLQGTNWKEINWSKSNIEIASQLLPARTTLHTAQPADRVTDNRDQFRKRWQRVSTATHFTEAAQ